MAEPIVPIIRLPVRPENVVHLSAPHQRSLAIGGVRTRLTVYIVAEVDMASALQSVTTVTLPLNARIELKVIE